ncbi:NAD(P)H-binding protein [Kitasatospora sp. NPDC036755]|uniref:NAD(P)H-binding protein n=1 Tax=Kitasatospora sp. NPDC036755 TaxID=3154600 RepID=UPI0033C7520B
MTEIPVIGATGSVGRHVVATLAEGGHGVRALVRNPATAALAGAVELFQGHLTRPESLEPALAGGVEAVHLM